MSQFDSKFTSQTPVDSPDDSTLSESANQAFLVRDWARTTTVSPPPPPCLHHHQVLCVDTLLLLVFPQGFTYVAPSVLENMKEKFSFEPKIRSPRRIMGSPRTPLRYCSTSIWC